MSRWSLLLAPVLSQDVFLASENARDATGIHKDHLHKMLLKHGVEPDQANAMSEDWGKYAKGKILPKWDAEDWDQHHHPSYMHADGYEVKKTTFTSPSMKLKTGEAHFTVNTATHAPFPKGDYSLLTNKYRVIRADGTDDVGLAEVYLHHWLMGDTLDPNPLDYCEKDYYWGYGAEMRGMQYQVPKGYAVKRIGAKGKCGLNMHFIRVEDLLLNWKGLNNPNGSWGAAVKNCAECGWAPNRAAECLKNLDGTFACCFTYSRCPVNTKSDREHKEYRLQYDVEYTEDLATLKTGRVGVLDISGGAVEWNIAPNKAPSGANTECEDTYCLTEKTWTVGQAGGFGSGVCAGELVWGYTHQHIGAINSTFSINGKPHCTSYPVIGTDPSNPVGNEKGFVVKFTNCVDKDTLGNHVRLNEGDKVNIKAYYDVDVNSVANLPLPGGKHGGVMDLFFTAMECDPGTFGEVYVCRQSTCVPTFAGKASDTFETITDCEASCS